MEHVIEKPVFEHLSQERLEAFTGQMIETMTTGDRTESLLTYMTHFSTDIERAPYGGQPIYWAHEAARDMLKGANADRLQELYTKTYGKIDAQTTEQLFSLDLLSWNRLHDFISDYYGEYPRYWGEVTPYDTDQGYMRYLTAGAWAGRKLRFDYELPNIRLGENEVVDQRIANGMPRELQLLGAALILPNYASSESQNRTTYALRFDGLMTELGLSNDEAHAVTKLAITQPAWYSQGNNPAKLGAEMLATSLSKLTVLERLQDDEGKPDLELFGGRESLARLVQLTFEQTIASNGHRWDRGTSAIDQLEQLEHLYGQARLSEILPASERTASAVAIILGGIGKFVTHDTLDPVIEPLFDTGELAESSWDMFSYFMEHPEAAHNGNPSTLPLSHIARALSDVDVQPETLRLLERPYAQLLDNVISYAAKNSDIYDMARQYKIESGSYDTELLGLLNDYRKIALDDCFRFYTDGWDGSEETSRWVEERVARADELRPQLHALKAQITAKAKELSN